MKYSRELSDNLHSAFLAVSNLRIALYDAVDAASDLGDTESVDRLLKATDHLRVIDKTINHYAHEMTESLMKELVA